MERKIYDKLLEWKNSKEFKPLMILGARQVGKTYIINEFGNKNFKNFISINLFNDTEISDLYNENISSEEKFLKLKLILNIGDFNEDTCIFIDEIQESEKLISELKYFNEKHSNVRIICAGNLLGVKLKRAKFSFPVGKVTMLTMYPMDFEEFLNAIGQNMLASEIKDCFINNKPMLNSLHHKALELYKMYLCVGGMPESIKHTLDIELDLSKYSNQSLNDIISSYFKDMDKYVISENEALKIESTYNSIPTQLGNLSNKFQFSKVKKGAKSREYNSSLDWLLASNMVLMSKQIKTPEIPLKAFVKDNFFKLYINDVGLLINLLEIKFKDIILDNISLYKGVIAENYVAEQLTSNDISLYYWQNNGQSEVDFIIYTNDGNIPIEVKAGDTIKSKSLNIYMEKYNPKYAIRISTRNFGFDKKIKSVPLYATFCIKELI